MSEMEKLHELLTKAGIEHKYSRFDNRREDMGMQIIAPNYELFKQKKGYLVISHPFTRSGMHGLLEVWKMWSETQEFLNAEQAFKIIRDGLAEH